MNYNWFPGTRHGPNPKPCGQPVTNNLWQLCARHNDDRLRMIASDLVRAATNA